MDDAAQHARIKETLGGFWRPAPDLLVSEWAGQHRHLSAEASAEPGLWRNARAPHLVKPMDALSPYHPAERVVCKFASQTGKTEIILNFCGYIMDIDPGPILALQPNVTPMGEAFSKDRIAPMLRDSPTLAKKAGVGTSRATANTITHKAFPGGHLTIAGANSVAGLASRPIRYLVFDEIDRAESTKEGDPLILARKRLQTFRVRRSAKELLVSSPTYSDVGISVEYDKCSQQWEWRLPCLYCGEMQRPHMTHFNWDDGKPETVRYACESCGSEHPLKDAEKVKAGGKWVCVKDTGEDSVGFWMNQWSSPFARWDDTVAEWLDAGKDPLQRQAVTNTAFAECWEGEGDRVDAGVLEARAEEYAAEVPAKVVAITIGVDVQQDRQEAEVVGWGPDAESWSIAYEVLPGEPTSRDLQENLRALLARKWRHESGVDLSPVAMCVDSGNWSKEVYKFVKAERDRRIIPIKGASAFGADSISGTDQDRRRRAAKRYLYGSPVEMLGVGQIKRVVAQRLALPSGAQGSCHFPIGRGREYYDQITGERLTVVKHRGKRAQITWIPVHASVEALDCRVYAYAGLLLANPDLSIPVTAEAESPARKISIGAARRGGLIR